MGIFLYILRWGSNHANVAPFSAPMAVKCALVTWYFSAKSSNPEKASSPLPDITAYCFVSPRLTGVSGDRDGAGVSVQGVGVQVRGSAQHGNIVHFGFPDHRRGVDRNGS